MAEGVHKITADFEKALTDYTGACYAVAVDNQSNALFLSLMYEGIKGKEIIIPARTYPSVPCEIIHAGGLVKFRSVEGKTLKGAYPFEGSNLGFCFTFYLRYVYSKYLHVSKFYRSV